METKICSKCGIEKPITEFNWRSKKDGTHRSECKECHCKFMKNKYSDKREEVQLLKESLKCQKCGYNSYGAALDFHHLDPSQKDQRVVRLISNRYSLDKVKEEIKKCIVLCANCHRVFHWRESTEGITIQEYLSE